MKTMTKIAGLAVSVGLFCLPAVPAFAATLAQPTFPLFPSSYQFVNNNTPYSAAINGLQDGGPAGAPPGFALAAWYAFEKPGYQPGVMFIYVDPSKSEYTYTGLVVDTLNPAWAGWDNPGALLHYAKTEDTGKYSPFWGLYLPKPAQDIGQYFAHNPPTPQLAAIMAADGFSPSQVGG